MTRRRTLALALTLVFVVTLCVAYHLDRAEVLVMEDAGGLAVTVGAKKTYDEFVRAAQMDPLYPVGIPHIRPFYVSEEKMPRYYKYRERLLTPVMNQEICASCWAISVCHVISDRISLLTGGKIMRPLSHQELISCFNVQGDHGCTRGASPEYAYRYIAEKGIATDTDYPYVQGNTTRISPCKATRLKEGGLRTYILNDSIKSLCEDPYQHALGSPEYRSVLEQNMRSMKTEIFLNGPICVTVQVYKSLYDFDGLSIYEGPGEDDEYVGGHAAVCFGFAEEINGEEPGFDGDFWFVKNSWSSSWPTRSPSSNGFFYIRAGKNVCGIESRASSAQPVITAEIRANMTSTIRDSAYLSYGDYVADPSRNNYITKSTKLRTMLKK